LVTLFLDSLLIGLAYPDSGQCEAYTSEEVCESAAKISVSESEMCVFDTERVFFCDAQPFSIAL
jgi:hypothetical protein